MIREMMDRFLVMVFPHHCPVCDELLNDDDRICEECQSELDRCMTDDSCCLKCGCTKEDCNCKKTVFLFSGLCAPYFYRDAAKQGVINIKRLKSRENAQFFAHRMAMTVSSRFKGISFDFVTAVPMHRSHKKKSDFAHAEELAKALARELDKPYYNSMKQIKKCRSQHTLSEQDRRKNVRGIYIVKDPKRVEGRTVLLVDDIKTTGATLNECAHQLLLAGAEAVWCVSAALTSKTSCNSKPSSV